MAELLFAHGFPFKEPVRKHDASPICSRVFPKRFLVEGLGPRIHYETVGGLRAPTQQPTGLVGVVHDDGHAGGWWDVVYRIPIVLQKQRGENFFSIEPDRFALGCGIPVAHRVNDGRMGSPVKPAQWRTG